MTPDTCPDAETLAAYYDNGLPALERVRIDTHVSSCERCQAIVATLARTDVPASMPASERTWWSWRWLVPAVAGAAALVVWAVVRPPTPTSAPTPAPPPATLSARVEPQAVPAVPERAPAPSAAPGAAKTLRSLPRKSDVPATPGVPSQPADTAEAKRADAGAAANENLAAAPPVAPAAAPVAAARLMQADVAARPIDIASTDPSIRWRIRGVSVERTTDGGATWTPQTTGASAPLAAGSSPSPDVCWIVGRSGTVLRTADGRSWQTVAFPERADLIRVEATSAASATVTTADARRFTTDDGGATWKSGGLQEF